MAKNKEFIYNKTRELGMLNGSSVETGYYTIDGEAKPEKVYLITRFMRKDGTEVKTFCLDYLLLLQFLLVFLYFH